ncbi:MAG: TonB-dependent receptor plug domain-containing protein [Saprospiraceae bacterium]|nr:TonB-dependent receptor plug domain-containing protein [Saprospiraceae bacterium]
MRKQDFIFIGLVLVLTAACSSTNRTTEDQRRVRTERQKVEITGSTPQEVLANWIRRSPGAQVTDNGREYQVIVRGVSGSFYGTYSPLYVIDGRTVGHDFNVAAETLEGRRIKSVRVLRDHEATLYGTRAAGGVIEIRSEIKT